MQLVGADWPFISGIFCGLFAVLLLFLSYFRHFRRQPDLADGVIIFISAGMIPSGIKVCLLVFDPTVAAVLGESRHFVFLSGGVVIWLALDTITKIIRG